MEPESEMVNNDPPSPESVPKVEEPGNLVFQALFPALLKIERDVPPTAVNSA